MALDSHELSPIWTPHDNNEEIITLLSEDSVGKDGKVSDIFWITLESHCSPVHIQFFHCLTQLHATSWNWLYSQSTPITPV